MGFWWDYTSTSQATRVVEGVIASINNRDFAALGSMVADNVSFMDSTGGYVTGRHDGMLLLKRLLAYDPAFKIHLDNVTPHNSFVLAAGYTTGARQDTAERTLFKLLIENGLLAEWRSYSADGPKPIVQMLMGARAPANA
jgi:hypothetical protein